MIWKEMASVNGNCGPPLRPTYSWPSRVKETVIAVPSGIGMSGP
jgi:hypothetical protein